MEQRKGGDQAQGKAFASKAGKEKIGCCALSGEGLAEGTASTEGWRRSEAQARGRPRRRLWRREAAHSTWPQTPAFMDEKSYFQ